MQNSNNELFPTKDICLATVLYASGIPLIEILSSKKNNQDMYIFRRTSYAEAILGEYFAGERRVEPATFFRTYKYLLKLSENEQ